MRILLVEDEQKLAEPLTDALTKSGFAVDWKEDGKSGLESAQINNYDCILLDLNLPELDGIELAKSLREKHDTTPIIMVTARHQVKDRLVGFESGADDYVSKPFHIQELVARINAVIKRSSENRDVSLSFSEYELMARQNTLVNNYSKETYELTTKETSLLEFLIRNKNNAVSAETLLEHIWDEEANPFSDTVKTHIKTLRQKFDPKKKYIKTIRGKGYMLVDES